MKKYFFPALILGAILAPSFASAEVLVTSSTTISASASTTAQIFTLCQQTAIEKRDTTIEAAREIYNTAMSKALQTRKNDEKGAVAIDDGGKKVASIKLSVDGYKKAVNSAQDALTKSRKDAMAIFEADAELCRQYKKDGMSAFVIEKKMEIEKKKEAIQASSTKMKEEIRTLKSEQKIEVETKKTEIKTLRETFKAQLDAIRSFFSR